MIIPRGGDWPLPGEEDAYVKGFLAQGQAGTGTEGPKTRNSLRVGETGVREGGDLRDAGDVDGAGEAFRAGSEGVGRGGSAGVVLGGPDGIRASEMLQTLYIPPGHFEVHSEWA